MDTVTDINENPDTSSVVLKCITILCAVGAVVLPWFSVPMALVAMLLAVVCIILSIVAMCQKGVVFGIIMIIVGFIAGGVATVGLAYTALGLTELAEIQTEYAEKIQAAQRAGDDEQVLKLSMEMQLATTDKFMGNLIALAEKYGDPEQVTELKKAREEMRDSIESTQSTLLTKPEGEEAAEDTSTEEPQIKEEVNPGAAAE